MEKLHLNEFDIMGIFELSDINGIEGLVTPCKDGKYLSRSAIYYEQRTCREHNEFRSLLKELLTEEPSKRNFVIIENMLNCSGKVYYTELSKYLTTGKKESFEAAKKCLEEDCNNIINVIEGKNILPIENELPKGDEETLKRLVEMDNKMLLYTFANAFGNLEEDYIVTPGLGSIYIGPFMKKVTGCKYSNLVYSIYKKNTINQKCLDVEKLVSDKKVFDSDSVLLIDDNIGTGKTAKKLKEEFGNRDINVMYGALQYNWVNYSRVIRGEKDIEKFDIEDVDFLTPLNYPGHKILEQSVEELVSAGGDAYIEYLNSQRYRQNKVSDYEEMITRAELNALRHNIDLYNGTDSNLKETSVGFLNYFKELSMGYQENTDIDMEAEYVVG